MAGDVEQAARDAAVSLHFDMAELLKMLPPNEDFYAVDITWSRPGPTGNALCRLADRGLLDHFIWEGDRKRHYRFTPLGLRVRTHLLAQEKQP